MIACLVTNCSARKSAQSAPGLSSANLPVGDQATVTKHWVAAVETAPSNTRASDLYLGRSVRRMQRLAADLDVPLYIASAGLGLLKADEKIPSYDLSVSGSNPSAIQRRIEGGFSASEWWVAVQQTKYATPIVHLFEKHKRGLLLIAVSNAYASLLASDLESLSMSQRDRLRLFATADARFPGNLRSQLMPYDARVDALVRGSKVDFAQRAAEHFIRGSLDSRFPAELDGQRKWVEEKLSRIPVAARPKRANVDDDRIREIARELASKGLSYTTALNVLRRQHGVACEQSRFRRLFLEATQ